MAEPTDIPERLETAIRNRVFGATRVPPDEAQAGVQQILRLVQSRFAQKRNEVIAKLEAEDESFLDEAVEILLLLALRAWFHERYPDLADDHKTELHQKLKDLQGSNPGAFLASLRTAVNAAAAGDAVTARPVMRIARAIGGDLESAENGGTSVMPEDYQQIVNELHGRYAFDEAKLPERLHYARDPDTGDQVLSEGQINFLTGTLHALEKLAGAEIILDAQRLDAIAGIVGLLLLDGHHDPDDRGFFDHVKAAYVEMLEPASASRKEIAPGNDQFEPGFDQKYRVFVRVAEVLVNQQANAKVFFDAYASVSRGMVTMYDTRPPDSAGFVASVLARYNDETLAAGGAGGGGSGIALLDLPPLSDPEGATDEIVPENIRAVAAIYVIYQCDQMMLFSVVDRVVELFMAGLLPMGGDTLARKLDNWYWNRDDRVSPQGRMNHFTRVLGVPGGEVPGDVTPNSDFEMHLMRTVSSLAEFERERSVGRLFDESGRRVMSTTGEGCRKIIRDMAAADTLYGYAGAQFAAERMGRQLQEAMEILQLPRIREIYGVTTMYQVIERVAQTEFGATVNVVKHRTLAEEVRTILEIVADNHHVWSLSSDRPLFTTGPDVVPYQELLLLRALARSRDVDAGDIDLLSSRVQTGDLSKQDSDRLFRAAQYILAVSGVQSDTVKEYSQPVETPALPSIPGMGAFGGGGMSGMTGGGDVTSQLRDMLTRGETPTADQIKAMVGL